MPMSPHLMRFLQQHFMVWRLKSPRFAHCQVYLDGGLLRYVFEEHGILYGGFRILRRIFMCLVSSCNCCRRLRNVKHFCGLHKI